MFFIIRKAAAAAAAAVIYLFTKFVGCYSVLHCCCMFVGSMQDTVQEYTEAAKKKLGNLGESTQQKYEQINKQTAETTENALNNEASEPARQAAVQEEDKSSNSQNM
jgi:hypothetical protein